MIKKSHHDTAGKNILTGATHSTGVAGASWREFTFIAKLEMVVPFSLMHSLHITLWLGV